MSDPPSHKAAARQASEEAVFESAVEQGTAVSSPPIGEHARPGRWRKRLAFPDFHL
jgi:hypothetical protein